MPIPRRLGPGCGLTVGWESLLNLIVKLQLSPSIPDNINALVTNKPNLSIIRNMRTVIANTRVPHAKRS